MTKIKQIKKFGTKYESSGFRNDNILFKRLNAYFNMLSISLIIPITMTRNMVSLLVGGKVMILI